MDADTDLQALVAAIRIDKLRFLTAERHRAYAAILWLLVGHRRAHEIEIYYDDLMMEALEVVPSVEPGAYTPDAFRSDVRQLGDWGNLAPLRLEPRRIETLADRNLQKFLCRIDDDTVAVLEFLADRSRAAAAALSDRGRHLLRDAAERLGEAQRLARKIASEMSSPDSAPATEPAAQAGPLLRLSYLCLEADGKVDDAAQELAAFNAALVGFAVSPFRLEALAEVVERLEHYVEDYIAEATERARSLYRAARKLTRPPLGEVLVWSREQVQRRLRDDPFLTGSPGRVRDARELMEKLIPFFAPSGRFEILLERVHGSARDVVRRVHKHVENLRVRNIKMETLRDRSRELARLRDADLSAATAWVNALFGSAHLLSDLRCGTPDERAAPPRPARRYQSRRAAHRGEYLEVKRGSPGQSRALESLQLLRLGSFVDAKILRGTPRASLDAASLDGFEDFRSLLDAVKAHGLRPGKARRLLSYRVAPPEGDKDAKSRADFSTQTGSLDAPNLTFTRAGGGGRND